MADVHLLGRIGRTKIHDKALALVKNCGTGLQVLLRIIGLQPSKERGGFEPEINKTGASQREIEMGGQSAELVDDLLRKSAGILFFAFGKGEGSIGLKIAMGGVGHPHLRLEAAIAQTKGAGGSSEGGIEVTGDVERERHQAIEELRLALSKKDFGG